MRFRCRRVVFALVVLSIAVATGGCLATDEDGDALERDVRVVAAPLGENETRGEDEYWMVWVRGNETDERRNQAVCARQPPGYEITHGNRSVRYDPSAYHFDPSEVEILLAFDHEDESSACAEAEKLVVDPEGFHVESMGEYGALRLAVRDDGSLVVDGIAVPLGKAAEVTYRGEPADPEKIRVDGRFRVETLGAWPQERLHANGP